MGGGVGRRVGGEGRLGGDGESGGCGSGTSVGEVLAVGGEGGGWSGEERLDGFSANIYIYIYITYMILYTGYIYIYIYIFKCVIYIYITHLNNFCFIRRTAYPAVNSFAPLCH